MQLVSGETHVLTVDCAPMQAKALPPTLEHQAPLRITGSSSPEPPKRVSSSLKALLPRAGDSVPAQPPPSADPQGRGPPGEPSPSGKDEALPTQRSDPQNEAVSVPLERVASPPPLLVHSFSSPQLHPDRASSSDQATGGQQGGSPPERASGKARVVKRAVTQPAMLVTDYAGGEEETGAEPEEGGGGGPSTSSRSVSSSLAAGLRVREKWPAYDPARGSAFDQHLPPCAFTSSHFRVSALSHLYDLESWLVASKPDFLGRLKQPPAC